MKYTIDKLKEIKYNDLLKIAKSAGIKSGRVKTDKLIQLILNNQDKDETDSELGQKVEKESSLPLTLKCSILQDETNHSIETSTVISSYQESNASSERKAESTLPSSIKLLNNDNNKRGSKKRSSTFVKNVNEEVIKTKKGSNGEDNKKDDSDNEKKEKKSFDIPKTASKITKRRRNKLQADKNESVTKGEEVCITKNNACKETQISTPRERTLRRRSSFQPSPSTAAVVITPRSQRKNIIRSSARSRKSNIKLDSDTLNVVSKPLSNTSITSPLNKTNDIVKSPSNSSVNKVKSSVSQPETSISSPFSINKVSSQSVKNVFGSPSSSSPAPKFTIGRGDPLPKETKGSGKKNASNIPRFLSYANKIKAVPNFSKIHEKNFNSMQNLNEYIDQKKKRNEAFSQISSKHKTPGKNSAFKPTALTVSQATFDFTKKQTPKKTNTTVSTKSSAVKKSPKTNSTKKGKKAASVTSLRQIKSNIKLKLKSPTVAKTTSSTASNTSTAKKLMVAKQAFGSTKKQVSKENNAPNKTPALNRIHSVNPADTPGSIHRRRNYNPKSNLNKPLNYKPYTGALKPMNDRETLKKFANKMSNTKSSNQIKESQKTIIKGVRMNKRFELQMAKRGITT